ncbi:hypothetical protein BJX64DRAFT_271577 [Aspergillus heterothallicus]
MVDLLRCNILILGIDFHSAVLYVSSSFLGGLLWGRIYLDKLHYLTELDSGITPCIRGVRI